jgi:hypothetical protein
MTLWRILSGRELPLQQVVLDLPAVVDAEAVGQLDLLQHVPEEPSHCLQRVG